MKNSATVTVRGKRYQLPIDVYRQIYTMNSTKEKEDFIESNGILIIRKSK